MPGSRPSPGGAELQVPEPELLAGGDQGPLDVHPGCPQPLVLGKEKVRVQVPEAPVEVVPGLQQGSRLDGISMFVDAFHRSD